MPSSKTSARGMAAAHAARTDAATHPATVGAACGKGPATVKASARDGAAEAVEVLLAQPARRVLATEA